MFQFQCLNTILCYMKGCYCITTLLYYHYTNGIKYGLKMTIIYLQDNKSSKKISYHDRPNQKCSLHLEDTRFLCNSIIINDCQVIKTGSKHKTRFRKSHCWCILQHFFKQKSPKNNQQFHKRQKCSKHDHKNNATLASSHFFNTTINKVLWNDKRYGKRFRTN